MLTINNLEKGGKDVKLKDHLGNEVGMASMDMVNHRRRMGIGEDSSSERRKKKKRRRRKSKKLLQYLNAFQLLSSGLQ